MDSTQAQDMIDRMLAAQQQQRDEEQRRREEYHRQAVEKARQEHRQQLAVFFGDLWPMLEPYASETETDKIGDLWTTIDAAPLRLAPFLVQPANLRTYSGPGILWGKPTSYICATDQPHDIAQIFEVMRAKYQRQEEEARERAEAIAREEENRQRRQAEQAQEIAAWAEAYRAYLIEERANRMHNAALVDAWNKAHCQPYQIVEFAYPVGAGDEFTGEANEYMIQHPDGAWIDDHGYRLIVHNTGRTERRRYPVILWESAPRTYTPGPATPYYLQRSRTINGFLDLAGNVLNLYAPPAEETIGEQIADLIAGLRSAQKPGDMPAGAHALRLQMEREINGEPKADDDGANF